MNKKAAERHKNVATAEGRGRNIRTRESRGAAKDSSAAPRLSPTILKHHGLQGVLPNSPPKLGGVPFARFSANGGVVPVSEPPRLRLSKEAPPHFIDGAATPPDSGGELGLL